jgi:hypothetical protein
MCSLFDIPPGSGLMDAISDYDNAQNAYRAFGLANVFAASLYHDVRSNGGLLRALWTKHQPCGSLA